MKPANVNSVLMMGSPDSCMSSFLLEGAIHFAEQGYSVMYLTGAELDSLPLPVHGLSRPTPDVFSLIRFMYLPRWQDLLQHLCSLHLHSHVPTVIIVEALEHFLSTSCSQNSSSMDVATEASHAALVFAALIDAAAVCAKHNKTKAFLVVSLQQDILWPIIDIFFTDVVWILDTQRGNNDNQDEWKIVLQNVGSLWSHSKEFHLQFIPHRSSVVLQKVSFWDYVEKRCN